MMAYFTTALSAFEEMTKAHQTKYAGLLARSIPNMELPALQQLSKATTELAEQVEAAFKKFQTEGVSKDIKKLAS